MTAIEFLADDGVLVRGEVDHADDPIGAVVLLHGLGVDRNEDPDSRAGVPPFLELALALCAANISVLRFDFRGHGESDVESSTMTVAGETLDARAAFAFLQGQAGDMPLALVGASFGALSAYDLLASQPVVAGVLWNPLVDVRGTFVSPELPWGIETFGPSGIGSRTRIDLDGGFTLGEGLLAELRLLDLSSVSQQIDVPLLVLHGNADTYVSCAASRALAFACSQGSFVEVAGAGHGFGRAVDRRLVIPATVEWLRLQLERP